MKRFLTINVKHPSPLRFYYHYVDLYSTYDSASNAKVMSISVLVTAAESGEIDIDDTASMHSTPFCRVCLPDNHKSSICQRVKNFATIIQTRSRNFEYWQSDKCSDASSPAETTTHVSTIELTGRTATLHHGQI